LARIDLAEGRAARALATLNSVLDKKGADMPPRWVASLYELRARSNAAVHDYRQAYADLQEHMHRYVAANDAERNKQAAALRTRFEIDRQVAHNELLQRELALEKERTQRQKEQMQWVVAAGVAGAFVIALLTYILHANLRHKRQLAHLADVDALTALPNRRCTAELASQALATAAETHRPMTIAIVDLDHFKTINDRCGHAAGDHVLREFAATARASLRAADVVGRWGGEEFLIVLPDTTLDTALMSLQRLRAAALDIELPACAAGLRVSFSAGLATNDVGVRTLDEIIAQADAALYEAKHQGRDLVRIAEESFRMASTGVHRALRTADAQRSR
jgi:diguanylate cyclase (GGDEF)-like protein